MPRLKVIRNKTKKLVKIDPAMARELLSKLYSKQRPVRPLVVSNYAFQMRNGSWRQAQPDCVIHLSEDGSVLYDGRHRLLAIIESGTTQEIWVEYGATEEDYLYMDAGATRYLSDQLGGLPNSKSLETIGKMAVATENGDKPMASCLQGWITTKARVPRDMGFVYVHEHYDLLNECLSYGGKLSRAWANGRFRSTLQYASWLILWCFEGDCFPDFVDDFCKPGAASTNAVAMLQQHISSLAMTCQKAANLDKPRLIAAVCCAYECYCGKDDKKAIRPTMINRYLRICDEKIDEKRRAQNAARANCMRQRQEAKAKNQDQTQETTAKLSVKYPRMGGQVYHLSFGYGEIVGIEDDRLRIQFKRDKNPRVLLADVVDKGLLEVI